MAKNKLLIWIFCERILWEVGCLSHSEFFQCRYLEVCLRKKTTVFDLYISFKMLSTAIINIPIGTYLIPLQLARLRVQSCAKPLEASFFNESLVLQSRKYYGNFLQQSITLSLPVANCIIHGDGIPGSEISLDLHRV